MTTKQAANNPILEELLKRGVELHRGEFAAPAEEPPFQFDENTHEEYIEYEPDRRVLITSKKDIKQFETFVWWKKRVPANEMDGRPPFGSGVTCSPGIVARSDARSPVGSPVNTPDRYASDAVVISPGLVAVPF